MDYIITPPDGFFEAQVQLPLSKSMSNRALLIAALAQGDAPAAIAECDDTAAMRQGLAQTSGTVNIGRAGTAMRFLTAYYAATAGCDVTLDGDERMRQRPIGALVTALRSLGADVEYAGSEGFPPLHIRGRRLEGGSVSIDATVSSQMVSALMLIAPATAKGLELRLEGTPVSEPYLRMTAAMMRQAGVEVEMEPGVITIPAGVYNTENLTVEPDWSAAAFWYEIEALTSGCTAVTPPLPQQSVQGDSAAARVFADLGVVTEYDGEEPGTTDLLASPDISPRLQLDFSDMPDMLPAVTVTCCLLRVPFRFTGLTTLRLKEADRLEALCREMLRLGITLDIEQPGDILTWEGRMMPIAERPCFDTYGDHRMAMALAPVALYLPGIIVRDVEVVSKSYPEYWEQLRNAGFTLETVE